MFKLKIETDNAAFDDENEGRDEIARILRDVAERLGPGVLVGVIGGTTGGVTTGGVLHDTNGNRVGNFTLTRSK